MKVTKIVTPLKKLSITRLRAALCIAVMNHKGGCGKTSLVDAFAHVLMKMGYRVLIIDCDPQCNLSSRLGLVDFDDNEFNRVDELFNAITRENYMSRLNDLPINIMYPDRCMRMNRFDTGETGVIGLITGSPNCEIYAASAKKLCTGKLAAERLKEMIAYYKQYYDFVLIDTAPSIQDNALNETIVNVADEMIVPFDGAEAATGLGLFMRWLKYASTDQQLSPVFVLSKYQADTKDIRIALTGSGEKQFEGEERSSVFRSMKRLMGPHVCNNGIQELRVLRSHTFIGMKPSEQKPYIKVTAELLHRLRVPRENSLEYWSKNKVQEKLIKEMNALESGRQRNVNISFGKYYFKTERMEEEL